MNNGHEPSKENFVMVAVVTTGGTYPREGFSKVPDHQKVRIFISEAARELKISDFSGWIARADNREIDLDKSYLENSLTGEFDIDFGPREGGGGYA